MNDSESRGQGEPRRVPFDDTFRELSLAWLADSEMARLTRVGEVDPVSQADWFAGLADRVDYAIWGISFDGVPVGALGLKHIGIDEGAEYFMYIGDPAYWGRGIAQWAFDEIYAESRQRGLRYIYGIVGKDNPRSLHVDLRHGFQIREEREDEWFIACPVKENLT